MDLRIMTAQRTSTPAEHMQQTVGFTMERIVHRIHTFHVH